MLCNCRFAPNLRQSGPFVNLRLSWPYLDNRPIWRHLRYFLDFFVRNGNTPLRPVDFRVSITNPRETLLDAVDHDVAPRRNAQFPCPFSVPLVWIGNMKRQVIPTVLVSRIDDVDSLRGLVVPFSFFGADRVSPQGNLVGPEYLTLRDQHQSSFFLFDQNPVHRSLQGRKGKNLFFERFALSLQCCNFIPLAFNLALESLNVSLLRGDRLILTVTLVI